MTTKIGTAGKFIAALFVGAALVACFVLTRIAPLQVESSDLSQTVTIWHAERVKAIYTLTFFDNQKVLWSLNMADSRSRNVTYGQIPTGAKQIFPGSGIPAKLTEGQKLCLGLRYQYLSWSGPAVNTVFFEFDVGDRLMLIKSQGPTESVKLPKNYLNPH